MKHINIYQYDDFRAYLLDGYDVMRLQPHERLHFTSVL